MRIWVMLGLAVLLFGAVNVGSSMALSDIAGRPVVALMLTEEETRVPVQQSGRPAAPGEARGLGGQGVMFGYRFGYVLPDGGQVACTIRFRVLGCSGGWTPERAG
jgi:hypothetical protein